MAKRSFDLLLAFGLVVVLSCKYDPHPGNGKQTCGASGAKQCPNGYTCHNGTCWIPDEIPDASGPAPDAPPAGDGPSGSGSNTTTATSTGTACGGLNRACCANKQCTALDTICNDSGVCVACGISGRPCCANKVCPGVGSICNTDGNCVVCGSSGYVCCANNTCIGDTICSLGSCVPCGGAAGQPCCAGNPPCSGTLACLGATCQQPIPDGGVSTSTGTATAHDAGIDVATGTSTGTATVTTTVHDAGNDAATNTSTGTTTASKSKTSTGTETSTSPIITLPRTIFRTATGIVPVDTGVTTGAPSAH
jgi:hypothetical protein